MRTARVRPQRCLWRLATRRRRTLLPATSRRPHSLALHRLPKDPRAKVAGSHRTNAHHTQSPTRAGKWPRDTQPPQVRYAGTPPQQWLPTQRQYRTPRAGTATGTRGARYRASRRRRGEGRLRASAHVWLESPIVVPVSRTGCRSSRAVRLRLYGVGRVSWRTRQTEHCLLDHEW